MKRFIFLVIVSFSTSLISMDAPSESIQTAREEAVLEVIKGLFIPGVLQEDSYSTGQDSVYELFLNLAVEKDYPKVFDWAQKNLNENYHFYPAMCLAARLGRVSYLRQIISLRPNRQWYFIQPPAQGLDNDNKTPLHHACEAGHKEAAVVLLEAGAKIDAISSAISFSNTPLSLAVHGGHDAVVNELLARKANPNGFCGTSLLLCCIAKDPQLARYIKPFLQAGANPNTFDRQGFSPLMYAACYTPDAIPDLLEGGALPDIFSHTRRKTALMIACHEGKVDAVQALLTGSKKGAANPCFAIDKMTAFDVAKKARENTQDTAKKETYTKINALLSQHALP